MDPKKAKIAQKYCKKMRLRFFDILKKHVIYAINDIPIYRQIMFLKLLKICRVAALLEAIFSGLRIHSMNIMN